MTENTANHHDKAISTHLLHRMGFLSDELDWPQTKSQAKSRAAASYVANITSSHDNNNTTDTTANPLRDEMVIDEVANGAWRVRDPIHSILGKDANLHSETGVTVAYSLQMKQQEDNTTNTNTATTINEGGNKPPPALKDIKQEILMPMLPTPKELIQFMDDKKKHPPHQLMSNEAYAQKCSQENTINIYHVHAAFNAAAYSIVRGNERAELERREASSGVPMEIDGKQDGTATTSTTTPAAAGPASIQSNYEPPLLQAMESIRKSRMKSITEASGLSVPSFLKKNNTIPWFHAPVVEVASGSGDKKPSSSSSVDGKKDVAAAVAAKKVKAKSSSSTVTTSTASAKSTSAVTASSTTPVQKKRAREEPDKVTSSATKTGKADDVKSDTVASSGAKSPIKKRPKVSDSTSQQQEKQPSTPSAAAVADDAKLKSTKTPTSSSSKKEAKSSSSSKKSSTTTSSSSKRSPSSASKKTKSGSPSKTSTSSSTTPKQYNITTTRAILCATASLVFEGITPNPLSSQEASTPPDTNINPRNIPQNPAATTFSTSMPTTTTKASKVPKKDTVNMTTVLNQAKVYATRSIEQTNSVAQSRDRRREFDMDSTLATAGMGYNAQLLGPSMGGSSLPFVVTNPFANDENDMTDVEGGYSDDNLSVGTKLPQYDMSNDKEWTDACKPQLMAVLNTGAGNAILHDREWTCRAFRVVNLLQNLAVPQPSAIPSGQSDSGVVQWKDIRMAGKSSPTLVRGYPNYGPHLIVTPTEEELETFIAVFHQTGKSGEKGLENRSDGIKTNPNEVQLRALSYQGDSSCRRRLRKHFTKSFDGLPSSAYHVVVTTYADFVEDYAHFCRMSFQAVIMDDGMSWLGCAHYDPQGVIGKVWNSAIWSKNQNQLTSRKNDVFGEVEKKSKTSPSKNSETKDDSKLLQVGLTARHRILVASRLHAKYHGQLYKAPVPGLLSFLTPQFTDIIRDDWDRSKVYNCKKSMEHIRSLVARSVVVYSGVGASTILLQRSLAYMTGELAEPLISNAQEDEGLDEWLKRHKITQSRKFASAWFRPLSPMRRAFGKISLDPIMTAVKKSNAQGFVCEEVATASSLTMSGQNGGVVGLGAYRAAVRCGRSFSSEQGLRQHLLACHAPPGTWVCRSCGEDCGTSQARSHHERNCGSQEEKAKEFGGAVPSVGKAPKSRGPKKKIAKNLAAAVIPDKDVDGSTRVLGYRGVWTKNGKYFIKIGGAALTEGKEETLYLDTADEAAKRYDDVITTRGRAREVEMNYKEDGSRIMYDDKVKEIPEKSTDTAAVVPALAVINIKDLPKHVKPLLRDPNQTSRTGGNSKRYVYAYRGVCRQQRKGHDRWQSQISFNGCNHYLGTFDSEYDAAAVYAWAHLILYGEEATKQAQREGEEAAAKFEQRKKDIAEGKILEDPKPARKKKAVTTKKQKETSEKEKVPAEKLEERIEVKSAEKTNVDTSENSSVHSKKTAPVSLKEWNKLKLECAQMLSSGTKGTSKATILGTRKDIAERDDSSLYASVPGRIGYGSNSFLKSMQSFEKYSLSLPACHPLTVHAPSTAPSRCALLIGLQSNDFSWSVFDFTNNFQNSMKTYCKVSASSSDLNGEYGVSGMNARFRTMILHSNTILGRASDESRKSHSTSNALNRINSKVENTLGMTVGDVDCDVNGPRHSCSTKAAEIVYMPSAESTYQLACCNEDDFVTINGRRIVSKMGRFPLKNRDVCSVGARVFVFIDTY